MIFDSAHVHAHEQFPLERRAVLVMQAWTAHYTACPSRSPFSCSARALVRRRTQALHTTPIVETLVDSVPVPSTRARCCLTMFIV